MGHRTDNAASTITEFDIAAVLGEADADVARGSSFEQGLTAALERRGFTIAAFDAAREQSADQTREHDLDTALFAAIDQEAGIAGDAVMTGPHGGIAASQYEAEWARDEQRGADAYWNRLEELCAFHGTSLAEFEAHREAREEARREQARLEAQWCVALGIPPF